MVSDVNIGIVFYRPTVNIKPQRKIILQFCKCMLFDIDFEITLKKVSDKILLFCSYYWLIDT